MDKRKTITISNGTWLLLKKLQLLLIEQKNVKITLDGLINILVNEKLAKMEKTEVELV